MMFASLLDAILDVVLVAFAYITAAYAVLVALALVAVSVDLE